MLALGSLRHFRYISEVVFYLYFSPPHLPENSITFYHFIKITIFFNVFQHILSKSERKIN